MEPTAIMPSIGCSNVSEIPEMAAPASLTLLILPDPSLASSACAGNATHMTTINEINAFFILILLLFHSPTRPRLLTEKLFTRRLYSIPVKLHNQKKRNESFRAGISPMPPRPVCSLNNNFQDYLADGYRFCGRIAAGGVRLMRPDDHKVAGSHVYSRTTAIVESDVFLFTEFDSHGHA